MLRTRFAVSLLLVGLAVIAGCGGTTTSNPVSTGLSGGSASLSVRDTPPAGVNVLGLQVTVTGAVLQPGNVSLLNAPATLQIKKLETDIALLNTVTVPPGTYSSIQVTFANPDLTILNNSGSSIGACASGSVCEFQPPLNAASVSFSGAPFPLVVDANTQIALALDFDVTSSVQNDLSITPTITFPPLPQPQSPGQLEEINVVGLVQGLGSNQFTLLNSESGLPMTVNVDGSTQFQGFGCPASNFSCLVANQIVEVQANLMAAGALVATEIELESDAGEQQIEGVVVSVDSPTQFKMVVLDVEPAVSGVAANNLATVTLQNPSFSVARKDLDVTGFSFVGAADLLVGQDVQVRPLNVASGTPGPAITTDRVRLRMSQFTAQVASVSGGGFTLNNLPGLFTAAAPAPITQVQALTAPQTEYENVSGVAALSVGDTVSVEGLLFNTTGSPAVVLVVDKVRKR